MGPYSPTDLESGDGCLLSIGGNVGTPNGTRAVQLGGARSPRWWVSSMEQPPAGHSLPSHTMTELVKLSPLAVAGSYHATSGVPLIQPSMEVPLAELVAGTTAGWTGTAIYYIWPQQKKKKKTRVEKR